MGLWAHHTSEATLIEVNSDLHPAEFRGQCSLLFFPDLSALDTVDPCPLFVTLCSLGFHGTIFLDPPLPLPGTPSFVLGDSPPFPDL